MADTDDDEGPKELGSYKMGKVGFDLCSLFPCMVSNGGSAGTKCSLGIFCFRRFLELVHFQRSSSEPT